MTVLPRTRAARLVAACVLVVFLAAFLLLPPAPARLDPAAWSDLAARSVAGAYHVHSSRSDGAADKTAIAAAAARAGLRFVILTDHGDGTRPADPPAIIDGVLCLDGIEISTDDGHYVAMDMSQRSPYPLGGSAESVAEDVRALSGFGVAAHPDSPKAALRWTDDGVAIDGIEWLNGDTEWRDESRVALARAAAGYLLRPGPAMALLLDRPVTLARWDRMTASRRVVGLAGSDAHGGIGRGLEDGTRSNIPGFPSYDAAFQTFSTRVILERPLTGDAAADARLVYGAIRAGHVFTTVDAVARPGLIDFRAQRANGAGDPIAVMGDEASPGEAYTFIARVLAPSGAETVLLRDGREVARAAGELRVPVTDCRGSYRIEVRVPGAPGQPPIPWLVSNPIYCAQPTLVTATRSRVTSAAPVAAIEPSAWRIEKDPGSSAILRTADGGVELEYTLTQGSRNSQYVAIAAALPSVAFSGIRLKYASDAAMRFSVQFRSADGARWGRSVFADHESRDTDILVSALRPFGGAGATPASLTSVLLVVDLTNANPGRSGTLRLLSSALVH